VLDAEAQVPEPRPVCPQLVDLAEIDDAPLGGIRLAVGFLDQTAREGLHVVADADASVNEVASPMMRGTCR
jgi:hypothetical protein